MTYKTDLQTNNTNLQSILDKVNALPEAGGGGSVITGVATTSSKDSLTILDAIGKSNIIVMLNSCDEISASTYGKSVIYFEYLNGIMTSCVINPAGTLFFYSANGTGIIYDSSTGTVSDNGFGYNIFETDGDYFYIAW